MEAFEKKLNYIKKKLLLAHELRFLVCWNTEGIRGGERWKKEGRETEKNQSEEVREGER